MSKFVIWFTKITAWPVQFLCFRTKVYYKNKKSQSRKIDGPAIVISNHTSIFDFAVHLFVFFGSTIRYQMAEVLFKKKFLGWYLKKLGGIYVDRFSHDFAFVDESLEYLSKGGVVGIFPESRLPLKDENPPLPFTPTMAYIAYKSGVPIIPSYTNGSYFSFKRARVIIGEKIYVDSLWDEKLSEKENLDRISNLVREEVIKLKNELNKQIEDSELTKPHNYIIQDIAKITGALPVVLGFRPKFIYENENAKKRIKGPVIYYSNHYSFFDPILLMVAAWNRRLHILVTREAYDKKVVHFFFRQFHCICVDKENFNMNSFRQVELYLKKGKAVGIFPEGGINVDEKSINTFKSGIVLMALKGNAPIIPVFIEKRTSAIKRTRIVIGEAININDGNERFPSMDRINKVSEILRNKEIELKSLIGGNK